MLYVPTMELGLLQAGRAAAQRLARPSRPVQLRLKRAVDVVLTILVSPLVVAVLMIAALAIRLTSPGPILLRQQRHGLHGRPFGMWKLRTMYHDRCDATGTLQAATGDPRVTPVGRWLRKFSVDELPQFINVLRGEMSLVGPRPHPIGMLAAGRPYDELVPGYPLRHAMLPGLTGLAQCNGLRGPTGDAELARARIEHDLRYIEDYSLLLDASIVIRTIRQVVGGTGS